MSYAPKFGRSLSLVPAQNKYWGQLFPMNDAGLHSVLFKKPCNRSPIVFCQNIFYCLVVLKYFFIFPLHSLILLILGLTSLDHTKKFHPESVLKLCIWLLLWHIMGSFLSGQLFLPLRILTRSELSESCRSRCLKQPGCAPSSLPLSSFRGRVFLGSDMQGWPRCWDMINSFQVLPLTNSQFPSV